MVMFALLMCLTFLPDIALSQKPGIQCFVPGECLDSQILDTAITNSSRACLHHCQTIQGCEWFTFYTDSKVCTSLSGCLDLSTKKCSANCISGENECPEFHCGLQGRCFGALEGIRKVGSARECGTICSNRVECLWHTYNPSQGSCTLTNDCPALDKSCSDCVVSEAQCEGQGNGSDGIPTKTISDSTSMAGKDTPNVPTFLTYIDDRVQLFNISTFAPIACQEPRHTFNDGLPGNLTTVMNNTLYTFRPLGYKTVSLEYFDAEQKLWVKKGDFPCPRVNVIDLLHGARFQDGSYFLFNPEGTTTLYIDESGAHNGPFTGDMSSGGFFWDDMCVATINTDDVFVSGGYLRDYLERPNFHFIKKTLHLNRKTMSMDSLPELPSNMAKHSCGTYETKDGPKIFIFGGISQRSPDVKNTLHIAFDWTSKTFTTALEIKFQLPLTSNTMAIIPFSDTFFIPLSENGGHSLGIYKFDHLNRENALQFMGKLTSNKSVGTILPATVVPRMEALPCILG